MFFPIAQNICQQNEKDKKRHGSEEMRPVITVINDVPTALVKKKNGITEKDQNRSR